MILYHGTNIAFNEIDLSKSQRYKDFNRAFYLSPTESQAHELAMNKVDFLGGTPIVYKFNFDEAQLHNKSLSIKTFDKYCEEWAAFVWNNRDENQNFTHDYDIVYGPIANDTIGLQMREYRRSHQNNLMGFLQGIKYYKGETYQYAFCTERAIKLLKRL